MLPAFLAVAIGLLPGVAHARPILEARNAIVEETFKYLNVPYLWGGQHPKTGLDCSGFVQLVYRRTGLHLPRVCRDQFHNGRPIKPRRVLPGDLVFFAMRRPGTARIDHVGIYLGKGFFVHASFSNGVHINSLANPYYIKRLVGIRKYKGF